MSLRYLVRVEHRVSGFSTIYRYSLPAGDTQVPVVFRSDPSKETSDHGVSPDKPPLDKTSIKQTSTFTSTPTERVATEEPQGSPTLPTTRKATGEGVYRSSGLSGTVTRLGTSRTLKDIEEITRRIGTGELPNPTDRPAEYSKKFI